MTTPNLIAMFAQPFASLPLPGGREINPALLKLIGARASDPHRDPLMRSDPLCFKGREDLFEWPEEPAARLRQEMLAGVCSAVMAANTFTEEEFDAFSVQARARIVIVRPNGALPATSVPLASWCGLYCVSAPPPNPARPDSASLRLYESRMANMFLDASNWRLKPPYSPGHHLWLPTAGVMAVFPASIMHEVALNRGDGDMILAVCRVRFANQTMEALPPW